MFLTEPNNLKINSIDNSSTSLLSRVFQRRVVNAGNTWTQGDETWAARTGSLILLDALPSMASAVDAFRLELILKIFAVGSMGHDNLND